MRTLVTICARGGSKGVPGKNIRPLLGKPLIAYTIETAKKWGKFSDLIVSTDSEDIANVALEFGAATPFRRPACLAGDSVPKILVIQHAVESLEEVTGDRYELIVDLDPTAPLRSANDIDGAVQLLLSDPKATHVYSVTPAAKNPYFNMVELDEEGYSRLCKQPSSLVSARQQAPQVYAMNASIYVFHRDFLMTTQSVHSGKARVYPMPPEKGIDIDREIDFLLVEFLLKEGVVRLD